jgi:hypothetical protein
MRESPVTSLGYRFKFVSTIILLIASVGVLSSCASKKKDYSSRDNRFPLNVVEVDVSSLDPAGDEFARQLEYNLKQSVGSPSFTATRNVTLNVQTHPNGVLDKSTKSLFRQVTSLGGTSVTATVRVMDSTTGASLRYEQITSSSTKDDIEIANLFIEEDLIAQIRSILGLTLYPPRPISYVATSINNSAVQSRDDAKLVYSPEQQVADPLLNGQITPETRSDDIMEQVKEMDKKMSADAKEMKRKVNKEAKMVKDALMEDVVAPEKKTTMDEAAPLKKMDKSMMKDDDVEKAIAGESDLCIVTVDNDCLGPNVVPE